MTHVHSCIPDTQEWLVHIRHWVNTLRNLVKAMLFPVVMYGCESWTIKKAECQRIDAIELWCWRRLLRLPWTAEIQPVHLKGNQSWIFTGRTGPEAETPILWPPDTKSWLSKESSIFLMLEKIDSRRRGRQRMRWLDSITNSKDKFEQALVKMVKDREAWCIAIQPVSRTHWATDNSTYIKATYIEYAYT